MFTKQKLKLPRHFHVPSFEIDGYSVSTIQRTPKINSNGKVMAYISKILTYTTILDKLKIFTCK